MNQNNYEIAGKENARSILFVHGAGVTRTWWQPQMAHFSDRFRVIAFDLPGHGTLAGKPFQMENSLECIKYLFEHELKGKALIVGISLGGYLAINYAQKYPNRVAGLFLSGSSVNMSGIRGLGFRLTGNMLKRKGPDWLAEVTIASYRKRVAAQIIEPVIKDGIFAKAAIEAFFELSGKNIYRMLKAYPGPVMVANGENDEPNRKAEKPLRKQFERFISSPIKEASHLANLEQPDGFNECLQEFAESLSWS